MDARQILTVPGTLDGVRQAADGFDAFAAAHGLGRGEVWPFQVTLDEVLSNVVRHGLSEAAEPPPIEIEIHLHHRDDTEATLRAKLEDAIAEFRAIGALSCWPFPTPTGPHAGPSSDRAGP